MLSSRFCFQAKVRPTTQHHSVSSRAAQPRTVMARSFQQEGLEVPDTFKQALQEAMSRDNAASSEISAGSYGSGSSYSRPSPPPGSLAAANASPLLAILATALGQSRATLERLQAEEAEIENLIQKEQKQVERMEWLLQTVQKDYAYFNYLQKRFEDETGSVRKY